MRLTVLYDIIILGHCITIFPGHRVIINLGRCLSGLYTMRLVGMRVVDPVYTTIRKRCFHMYHFQTETIQSVLLSVRQGDWMASIDLKEAYLQVPVHPESRPSLHFVSRGHVFQFKALCFGLSTAPQVFSRGHGSYFRHSPRYGYPHVPVYR